MKWLVPALAVGCLVAADPSVETFDLDTTIPQNATVKAGIVRGDKPNPALPVLAYFPYPGQREWSKAAAVRTQSGAGWTVVGMHFEGQDPEKIDIYARATCAYYPESGSGDAWIRALTRAMGGQPRPWFINGESAGGSMAAQFAAAQPERTACVAIAGGRILPETVSAATAWLVIASRHDLTEPDNQRFVARLRAAGAPVLYATTSPDWGRRPNPHGQFEHCQSESSQALQLAFLNDAAELAKTGKLPPQAEWPVVTDAVLAAEGAPPAGVQLRLPGARTKAAWEKVQRHVAEETVGAHTWRIRCPGDGITPTGVVIATLGPDNSVDPQEWAYDLEYLADLGLLVLEQGVGTAPADQNISALPAIAATPRFAKLPAVAVHVGTGLQHMASVPAKGLPTVKGRVLIDFWPALRAEASTVISARQRAGEAVLLVRTPEQESAADQATTKRLLTAVPKLAVVEESVAGNTMRVVHLRRMRAICSVLADLKIIAALPTNLGKDEAPKPVADQGPDKPKPGGGKPKKAP